MCSSINLSGKPSSRVAIAAAIAFLSAVSRNADLWVTEGLACLRKKLESFIRLESLYSSSGLFAIFQI